MGRRMARREMMEESIWRVFVATPQEGDYSLEHWALTNKVGARQMFRFLAKNVLPLHSTFYFATVVPVSAISMEHKINHR